MPRFALIGGTGIADSLPTSEPLEIDTPYGDVRVGFARAGDDEWIVLARHGADATPAHRVNHHAHVDALARAGVVGVFSIASVGALDASLPTGTLVVPHDLLDLGAPLTFHDERAVHVDMRAPFCPRLGAALATQPGVRAGGVYAQARGPRLETPAETRALAMLGATMVGMTVGPEATLARERGLCYAPLCVVANAALAASAQEIRAGAHAAAREAVRAAMGAAGAVGARDCACGALDAARL